MGDMYLLFSIGGGGLQSAEICTQRIPHLIRTTRVGSNHPKFMSLDYIMMNRIFEATQDNWALIRIIPKTAL